MSTETDRGTVESLWRLWRQHRRARKAPPGAVMEIGHDEHGVHGSACPDSSRRDPDSWVEFHGRTVGDVLDQAVRHWPDHCFEVLVAANSVRPSPDPARRPNSVTADLIDSGGDRWIHVGDGNYAMTRPYEWDTNDMLTDLATRENIDHVAGPTIEVWPLPEGAELRARYVHGRQ